MFGPSRALKVVAHLRNETASFDLSVRTLTGFHGQHHVQQSQAANTNGHVATEVGRGSAFGPT